MRIVQDGVMRLGENVAGHLVDVAFGGFGDFAELARDGCWS